MTPHAVTPAIRQRSGNLAEDRDYYEYMSSKPNQENKTWGPLINVQKTKYFWVRADQEAIELMN